MFLKLFKSQVVSLIICLSYVACTHANDKINTITEFEKWIENKIFCKSPTTTLSIVDKDFVTQIKKLGFDIDITIDKESGHYEAEILTNNKLNSLFGFNIQRIIFYQTYSINAFYADIQASPKNLKNIVENRRAARFSLLFDVDPENVFTFPTSKPDLLQPYGRKNQAIIIKTTDQEDISSIGCWKFDY